MFDFPVGELMMGGPYSLGYYRGTGRFEYLKLLVAAMVATPEEQAEYAAIARPAVEEHWQKILEIAERKRLKELEQLEYDIVEDEKNVLLLRQVGAYEYAVKMEVKLDRMREMRGSPKGYKGGVLEHMNFRGFPFGTGGDLTYDLKYGKRSK